VTRTTITHADLETYRGQFVSVTEGMSGHFAVIYWWNKDMGGFWEPYDTGIGRYATEDEARVEAVVLSTSEDIPYLLPEAPKA
jgi:hypothetical protein